MSKKRLYVIGGAILLALIVGAAILVFWPAPSSVDQFTQTRTCDFLNVLGESPMLMVCEDGTAWFVVQQPIQPTEVITR